MARHQSGWVCTHRSIFDHPVIGRDPNLFIIFSFLYVMANHEDSELDTRAGKITVTRGQIVTSIVEMSNRFGVPKSTVHRGMQMLSQTGCISYRKRNANGTGGIIVTIQDYGKFQDMIKVGGTPTGRKRDAKWDANGTPMETYEQRNKETKKKQRNKVEPDSSLNKKNSVIHNPVLTASEKFRGRAFLIKNLPSDQKQGAIAKFCEGWKSRWQANFTPTPFDQGQILGLVVDLGYEKTLSLIESFFQMPDGWFIEKRHAPSVLVSNLPKVMHFSQTGRNISKKEIREIDKAVGTMSLMEKIRSNGI